MRSIGSPDRYRKLGLAFALAALTIAVGLYGGNLRNGIVTFTEWSDLHKALFINSILLVVFAGGPPVRDFVCGEWRPFFDHSLNEE